MPTPLEFGSLVGAQKQAMSPLAITGKIAPRLDMRRVAHGFLLNHPNIVHYGGLGGFGAALGAAEGAYRAPKGQKLEGLGRGAAAGAVTGLGTAAGTDLGLRRAGLLGMVGLGLPASIGSQYLGKAMFNPPVAKTANAGSTALSVVKPLVGEIVRRPPITINATRVVREAAPQAAGNALKYMGAAGAGLGLGGAAGYALGRSQGGKQKAANALAALPGQAAQALPGLVGSLSPAAVAAGTGLGVGAAAGAYKAPKGQKIHGALSGAARVPGQVLGGIGGAIGGAITAPFHALGHVAGSALDGMDAGGAAMDRLTGAPKAAPAVDPAAAKQAGFADKAKTMMDKGKQVAGKAESLAKGVANKAVDIGAKAQQGFDKWRKTPNPAVKATAAGSVSKAAMFGAQLGLGRAPGSAY